MKATDDAKSLEEQRSRTPRGKEGGMARRWTSQPGTTLPGPGICGSEEAGRISGNTVKSPRVGRVADRVVVPFEGEGQQNHARGKGPDNIGA